MRILLILWLWHWLTPLVLLDASHGHLANADDRNAFRMITEDQVASAIEPKSLRRGNDGLGGDNRYNTPPSGGRNPGPSPPSTSSASSSSSNLEGVNLSGISGNVFEIVSITCFILVSSCLLQFLVSKVYDKIPISLVLFIFGMTIYGSMMAIGSENLPGTFLQSLSRIRKIDNSVLYYIALPILLYEATQAINWYRFCNFLVGGVALAVGGVILQVVILGVLFRYTLGGDTHWSYTKSFLLASILSSTDPVAVMSVLGDVRAPTKIISMFNGESLINDGTSVLMFQFFYLLSVGRPESYSYYQLLFIKLLVLSPLLGVLIAFVVIIWISFFRKYHMAQCISVVGTSYLVFFISEYLNLSGPLCIVCYGVYIKAYGLVAFDREALEKHHNFVEGISNIANSAVFVISGMLTIGMLESQFMLHNVWIKIFKLLMVYLFLNIARSVMIISFSPLLSYIGYRINVKETILLIWGGLRGAMVLVLGLRLECDPRIDDGTSDILAFYIGGSTMLILLLQGFTFDWLYRCLNPYPMKPFRRVYLEKTMQMIDFKHLAETHTLGSHWLFKDTDVIKHANLLVPSLSNVKWNKIGKLVFQNPKVDHPYEIQAESTVNAVSSIDEQFVNQMNLPLRCATVMSAESDYSLISQDGSHELLDDDDEEENIFLFANGALQRKNSDIADYDPKLYLRLLERATESQSSDLGKSLDNGNGEQTPEASKHSGFHLNSQVRHFLPQRTDTEATINLENLYLHQYSKMKDYDNECPSGRGKKVLRLEREGELYIMIFNAFSHLYNEMYQCGFIDGRSLLSLQSSLDIAADFAIKRLKQRSIAVWKEVLSEYIQDPSNCDFPDSVDEMDGFAFEWFVLHSIISGNYTKRQFYISNKHRVISILEILVAYVDVHQQLLERGGKSLEKLLESTLLESYKRQIVYAKSYVKAVKAKWPSSFSLGLLNKAACMMIRIKKEIVNEQCVNGLLLDEDRRQIQEMLDDQLHRITTKIDYTSLLKQSFRRFVRLFNCKRKSGNAP